jgi:hypothetical protein
MSETEDELAELQRLLDAAAAHSNPHMRSIVTPERRLSAAQVVTHLQGTRHVALATVTANGEPRVSLLLIDGNPGQVGTQLVAIAAVWIYSAFATLVILKLVDVAVGLRVGAEEEEAGLDVSQHGEVVFQS